MRVYLPSTTTGLRRLLDTGLLGPPPLTGFAATPGLRAYYQDGDLDELEYAAMMLAARASLRLIDAEIGARPRRVVLAADIGDADLSVRDDIDDGVVQVERAVAMATLASAHVDDAEAEATIGAAAAAIVAADIGDEAAQDSVDDAEGYELSWYATQEFGALLELL